MRLSGIVFAGAVMVSVGCAQQSPPSQTLKTFASSSEVKALIAHAREIHKPGQALVSQPILLLTPYRVSLEYRESPAPPAIHKKEAEVFYVIEGAGTLVTGGKIVDSEIAGGKAQALSKGDFLIVPENTPHWFKVVDQALVVMSLHLPRGAP